MMQTYKFTVRDSTVAGGDNRKTGLTPAWVYFKNSSTGGAVTGPSISEIGNGDYKFAFDPVAGGVCDGQLDCGSTLTNGSDRYLSVPPLAVDSAGLQIGRVGTAQGGAASTITLDSGASANNDSYIQHLIFINSGTGAGQNRTIIAYSGTTKVATVDHAWTTQPDNTSVFATLKFPLINVGMILGAGPMATIAAAILKTPANLLATDGGGNVAANNLPSDYQQRGQPVTLPNPPPSGYAAGGSGTIPINQNTGGTDNLRYVDANGAGIGGATILIYQASDWPAFPSRVQATAATGNDGRWIFPAFVSAGTYVAVFGKVGADGPDVSPPFTV